MAAQMTTDTVKNAKMTTESVVNFLFFETLTTEKSATVLPSLYRALKEGCFLSINCSCWFIGQFWPYLLPEMATINPT